MSSWLPEDWAKRFGTGTAPVNDPTAYPDKATLLDALDDEAIQSELNNLIDLLSIYP